MRKHIKLIPFVIIIALVLSMESGSSGFLSYGKTSVSDLENQMEDIQDEIEKAQKEILARNTELSFIQSEISKADLSFERYSMKLLELEQEINVKEDEITLTEINLEQTTTEQEAYYEQTKERIKVMYEHGNTDYLEVLLESKDTSDFFNRLEYLNKLIEYDQSILDEMDTLKATIISYENELLGERQDLEELRIENTKQLNEIELLLEQKKDELSKIENDKELLFENIQQWEKEQEELDAKIQELIRLYSDQNLLFGDGKLSWPISGYTRVTSKFGPRIHPVYGYKSTHTGIDIPAPYGQDILAAGSGKVIFAGWGNAYGNYILIDHGRDSQNRHIVTQYAHCSRLLVVEGDVILRGDVIGKVGSTGWSTGNHLHYGVQIGGTWIDPLNKTDK